MTVKLIYFKPGGKYYAEGTYETLRTQWHDILTEAIGKVRLDNGPGVHHSSQFIALFSVPEHEHNVPHLINTRHSYETHASSNL